MARYGLKKLLEMLLTLFIVVTLVFFLVRMIPGDPARMIAGEQATLEDVENVREALGLNKPVGEQYVSYITGLFHGDLGTSMRTKRPVAEELAVRYPNTVKLALVAISWSVIVARIHSPIIRSIVRLKPTSYCNNSRHWRRTT